MAAATLIAGAASAQPYGYDRGGYNAYPGAYSRGYDYNHYRDSDRDGRPDYVEWGRDRDHDGRPDQWDRHDNRRDRYRHHRHHYSSWAYGRYDDRYGRGYYDR